MGPVILEYVPSYSWIVDMFTKPLGKEKFDMLRKRLGPIENAFLTKEC